ncbi:MAG: methylated-DNA--[protein]-cysteine S-methyltransferase [Thermoleophilia bacterium]
MSTNSVELTTTTYETEYGPGLLVWRNGLLWSHTLPAIRSMQTGSEESKTMAGIAASGGINEDSQNKCRIASLLELYFRGRQISFEAEKIHLDRSRWSQFENDVAEALWKVPFGGLVTYAQLARLAGHESAHRAVGNFMAKNPFPVILPCHRVVRSDGDPGGYSGGKDWKNKLASIEGSLSPQVLIE